MVIGSRHRSHWRIKSQHMIEKVQFPVTSIFGRFFNDFLDKLPVQDLYVSYAKKVSKGDHVTTFYLDQGKGTLFINYYADRIAWIGCEIYDKAAAKDIISFATKKLYLKERIGVAELYFHPSGFLFSISKQLHNGSKTYTCQLFLEK